MSEHPEFMQQSAPYPIALAEAVARCRYRSHEGWTVYLEDDCIRDVDSERRPLARGLTLIITTCGFNTYDVAKGRTYTVSHFFIVPAATYAPSDWERWLFEQFAKVELHEAMESYVDADGRRAFAPTHGQGRDPYTVREYIDESDRSARFNDHITKGRTP